MDQLTPFPTITHSDGRRQPTKELRIGPKNGRVEHGADGRLEQPPALPVEVGAEVARVAGDADDAVPLVAPRELGAVQPRARLADAVALQRHQRPPVREVVLRDAAALLADGLGAHGRHPHDADRARRLRRRGRRQDGGEQPREEEDAQDVDAQVYLVALGCFCLALAVAEGLDRGVVEEDVQLGFFGFELLCGRLDLVEVG